MVTECGRNWKGLSEKFFESRAPLALKNRYSLLIRRQNRQGDGQHQRRHQHQAQKPHHPQQQQQQGMNGLASERSGSGLFSCSSSGATSPSSGSAADLMNYFGGVPSDYTPMDSTSSSPSIGMPFSPGIRAPSFMGLRRDGTNAPVTGWPTTTSGDDRWPPPQQQQAPNPPPPPQQQQQNFLFDGIELFPGTVSSGPPSSGDGSAAYEDDNDGDDAIQTTPAPDYFSSKSQQQQQQQQHWLNLKSISSGGSSGVSGSTGGGMLQHTRAGEVEYSVTCQRGRLKTVMRHLVDAAMVESRAAWTAEEDRITVTLRLRV